jgi:hypothetical protein
MSKTATAKKAATSKAEFQTFEAIRACTAGVLSRFQNIPPTRYEGCFIQQDTVSARGVNLIAGRGKPPTKTSTATEKTRRNILVGVAAAMICAPAIVRAASLMPARGAPLQIFAAELKTPRTLSEWYQLCFYRNLDHALKRGHAMTCAQPDGTVISVAEGRQIVARARTQDWLAP